MFWVDKLLENRKGAEIVNDAWTPSGIVHMGGLKGPVIHDAIYKVLKSQGVDVEYSFGFDDFDPIDGLPDSLKEKLHDYMGIPVCNAPSPDGQGTFGEYYGNMMRQLFVDLGIEAKIYLASEYYKKGIYDKAIEIVLNKADKVRKVYADIYGKKISDEWFPLQVVCSNCGKLGTTRVTSWDGKEVAYECVENLVTWARGCGQKERISPFGGNAKMPFKVEWAAKWWTLGVTIEGAGKDHASAGGTYDVARKIVKEVFEKDPPLRLPYEFFLVDGKKMSSSKGLGLTGEELLDVLSPQVARFLMIQREPNQSVEFNPYNKDIIPRLYDDYQKAALESNEAFKLSQVGKIDTPPQIRFAVLAQWVQMPDMEEEIKKANAVLWAKYARVWIEKYAPDDEKFLVQKETPAEISSLSYAQKEYLKKIADLDLSNFNPDDLQTKIYEISKEMGIPSKDAFQAIYVAILGKNHGPRAAWLIASLPQEFIRERFNNI